MASPRRALRLQPANPAHQNSICVLTSLVALSHEQYAAGDHAAMTQADARFHRIIAETSSNQAIAHVFDQLEPFARTFITLTLPAAGCRLSTSARSSPSTRAS